MTGIGHEGREIHALRDAPDWEAKQAGVDFRRWEACLRATTVQSS